MIAVFWDPPEEYEWKHPRPPKPTRPKIYECHIGMASEELRVATYAEFTRDVLPYIRDLGYNCPPSPCPVRAWLGG